MFRKVAFPVLVIMAGAVALVLGLQPPKPAISQPVQAVQPPMQALSDEERIAKADAEFRRLGLYEKPSYWIKWTADGPTCRHCKQVTGYTPDLVCTKCGEYVVWNSSSCPRCSVGNPSPTCTMCKGDGTVGDDTRTELVAAYGGQ